MYIRKEKGKPQTLKFILILLHINTYKCMFKNNQSHTHEIIDYKVYLF